MKFEYNTQKSAANLHKHGVTLEEAQELWSAPNVQIKARITGEPRFMIIGKLKGRLYSCIFTTRGESVRLISARRSHAKEEKVYHEHIREEEN